MTTAELIYASTDPRALDVVKALRVEEARVEALRAAWVDEITEQFGGDDRFPDKKRRPYGSWWSIVGFAATGDFEVSPAGWRRDSKRDGAFVPDLRTNAGREARDRLATLSRSRLVSDDRATVGVPVLVRVPTADEGQFLRRNADLVHDERTGTVYQVWESSDVQDDVDAAIAACGVPWAEVDRRAFRELLVGLPENEAVHYVL